MAKLAALRWAPTATDRDEPPRFAAFAADEVVPIGDGLVYWDAWPLLDTDGSLHDDNGRQLWFALAAPRSDNPDERHDQARIHLLYRRGDRFEPRGPAMPDGLSPGSREWSGSASYSARTGKISLLFTAAGRRGEAPSFEQRLFRTKATLTDGALSDWSPPHELLAADDVTYRRADQATGSIGMIKAFRDPDIFRDPATGRKWLLFTASSAARPGDHDGVIGLARIERDFAISAEQPLVEATGFNNELERPHIRLFDGRYYLFWSTQAQVFAGGVGDWPTGLYGAVADRIDGPWRLINGTGIVAANPAEEPTQAYSWLVLPDASVTSFVDHWGQATGASQFGGTFAPFEKLILDGDAARLATR